MNEVSRSSNQSALEKWVCGSPQRKRAYQQEYLIVNVTERIALLMQRQQMSKADLAKKLGCSKVHVTALLSGSRNMTLRTLSDIAAALGCRADFTLSKKQTP